MTDCETGLVAVLEKNSRERIVIALGEFGGHSVCDMRVHVIGDGELQPTRKGVCLRTEQLPALVEALQRAQALVSASGAALADVGA